MYNKFIIVDSFILVLRCYNLQTRIVDFGERIVSVNNSVNSNDVFYENRLGYKNLLHLTFGPQRLQDVVDSRIGFVRWTVERINRSFLWEASDQHNKSILWIPFEFRRISLRNLIEGLYVSYENYMHVPRVSSKGFVASHLNPSSRFQRHCSRRRRVVGCNLPDRWPFHGHVNAVSYVAVIQRYKIFRIAKRINP